jgi:hypothetical protein
MGKYMRLFTSVILLIAIHSIAQAQMNDVMRVEFNSGTRTYREQIILTPDSVMTIKEDFRIDLKPQIQSRVMTKKEWNTLVQSLKNVRLGEIENLQSPSMKRAYDGAAHGSIVITTRDGKSYAHGFDDEEPHEKFRPLLSQIRKFRKE